MRKKTRCVQVKPADGKNESMMNDGEKERKKRRGAKGADVENDRAREKGRRKGEGAPSKKTDTRS